MPVPLKNHKYSYVDYCTWDNNERWELIDGVAYALSPAPTPAHQRISRELSFQFNSFLKGKLCEVFTAPFDVRLNADKENNTVVQPDLVVICDHSKIDEGGCRGVPDLIIEILSPSTARQDRMVKFQKYQQAGVQEYWLVDPETKTVQVCLLDNKRYYATVHSDAEIISVAMLPGCKIDLKDVF